MENLVGKSADAGVPAVKGEYTGGGDTYVHDGGTGVQGYSGNGYGVHGISKVGRGVVARSETNYGLRAHSKTSAGARCSSDESRGVEGWSTKAEGVHGISKTGNGVWGYTEAGVGVVGTSEGGNGGWFESTQGEGMRGTSKNPNHGGVVGVNTAGGDAGFFAGNVHVTGILTVDQDMHCTNADCAEDFDIANAGLVESGMVMALGEEGILHCSQQAYDRRVVGVVSGAGDYRPAIVLDKQATRVGRKPIALLGKVFCKVDANYAPIHVGDLLTTSNTPGHAMKATDAMKAFGAVIGKALRPLKEGQGLIPIIIALQ